MTTKYVVRCEAWRSKPFSTREAAERNLALVEKSGECHLTHEIVEVEA